MDGLAGGMGRMFESIMRGPLNRATRMFALVRILTTHLADGIQGYGYGARLRASAADGRQAEPEALEAYFDQHTSGPGIWKWRHYFPIYERHLGRFVGQPVKVVEIGVFSGGSLGMWRRYFGERSEIYGVDIEPECRAYEAPGIRVFIGDQADRGFWRRFIQEVGDVDVVIDDGGHLPRQQIVTLEELLPHLRPGGVYLCEDVHGSWNPFLGYVHGLSSHLYQFGTQIGGAAYEASSFEEAYQASSFQEAVASVHIYPFVVVLERPAHRVEALASLKRGSIWEPFGTTLLGFGNEPPSASA
jgi:SAM-dependent methyltransferase